MKRTRAQEGRSPDPAAGFTLIEVLIVAGIMAILARSLVESSISMERITTTGNVRTLLQEQGERALNGILPELRCSGFLELSGVEFPYVFADGEASGFFDLHSHPPANSEAEPGDPDFGESQEIVYLLPADADLDGRPDIDSSTHEIVWSMDEISLTLRTRADGRNELQRRVNGGAPRSIARDIERIVFDTSESSGWTIPLRAVRVQIFLRRRDSEGALHRHRCEAMVRLRNSEVDG